MGKKKAKNKKNSYYKQKGKTPNGETKLQPFPQF